MDIVVRKVFYIYICCRGLGTVMQADYINFVSKFPTFHYHGNGGWSEANYIALHCYIRWPPNST